MSDAQPKQLRPHGFQPGNTVGAKGRPKGARQRLGEDFVQALQKDFAEHGVQALMRMRDKSPGDYLRMIASILPKQIEVKEGAFDGVSDEQLAELVDVALSALNSGESGPAGDENPPLPQSLN